MTKTATFTTAPVLRFSPTAWAKLLFLRDAGDTEIGGFGIAADDDLLLVEDVVLVAQRCTAVTVKFDDEAVADFFDAQVDAGRQPAEFGRVWIHTHPGSSAQPSQTDEATFARVFGGTDWAVMCILARGSQVYARLRYHVGPGADLLLPVDVDYTRPFGGTDEAFWRLEYDRCVRLEPRDEPKPAKSRRTPAVRPDDDWVDAWYDYTDFDHVAQEAAYDHDF